MTQEHGFLILDKPAGITSRQAVDHAASWFPRRTRLGHAGTLDPLATGVLVLAVGRATRLIEYVQNMPKTYKTRITLGARSDTDDADGMVIPTSGIQPISEAHLLAALQDFRGSFSQVPPAYSAAHQDGQRAHRLARQGIQVQLPPRTVHVSRIEVLEYSWPSLSLEIDCGKGTYIRSIARDLGERLGVGGLVSELRRTRTGPFVVEDAQAWNTRPDQLVPIRLAVSQLARESVSNSEAELLRHGQAIPRAGSGLVAVFDTNDELIGVAEKCDGKLHPRKVLG